MVPARTEAHVQTMSTATPVPANQALLASSVRPTYQTVLRVPVLMEALVLMGLMASNAPAVQASREIIASTR